MVDRVSAYVESEEMIADAERTHALLADLRNLSTDVLGEAWMRLLERVAARLEAGDKEQPPSQPPSP